MENVSQDIINLEIESSQNTELLHREKIDGSPLWIIGEPTNGYFIALGKYRLTDNVKTLETARLLQYSNMWDIMMNAITIITEKVTYEILEELNNEQITTK